MNDLTEAGQRLVDTAATHHRFPRDAVATLLAALAAGGGTQAQFDHPELGGLGQWSRGGMIMIGDMFNGALKQRVQALCDELAAAFRDGLLLVTPRASSPGQRGSGGGAFWAPWSAELGQPSSTGSQNAMRYAVFPGSRRLAVEQGGSITIYHTGDHRIGGVSQQQSGDQSLTFTSQQGLVRLEDLEIVPSEPDSAEPPATPAPPHGKPEAATRTAPAVGESVMPAPDAANTGGKDSRDSDDLIFSRLERLAELRAKDIISAGEFDAKKAELLARL
ncbi:MAG: SHOCT domain-containing protein [Novosphingobium sp.]